MADQTQPPMQQPFTHPPAYTSPQVSQNGAPAGYQPVCAPPFVAPAESFGSFGPLPGNPSTMPVNAPLPGNIPANAPLSSPNHAPMPMPPTPQAYPVQGYYPYAPGMTLPYAPGMPGTLPYAPYGMYPPAIPVKTKKPLLFPLTRHASVLLQIFSMLLYSLVVALVLMGCILTLLKMALTSVNVYVNADGSANGVAIIITLIIVLVIVPAISVFSGACFGGWRGVIVSLLALAGGLLLAHLSDDRFGTWRALQVSWPLLISPALTAMVVGFVYDRRQYAAWWKSMLTMFLGATVLLACLFIFIYTNALNTGNLATSADNAHMTLANYMAYMAVGFGCMALIFIPILGLFFAGIEGIIHAILAGTRRRG